MKAKKLHSNSMLSGKDIFNLEIAQMKNIILKKKKGYNNENLEKYQSY